MSIRIWDLYFDLKMFALANNEALLNSVAKILNQKCLQFSADVMTFATDDKDAQCWYGFECQKNSRERIGNAIEIYQRIEDWYAEYLKTDEARKNIAGFDRQLPSYSWITDVKKNDYLLWCER